MLLHLAQHFRDLNRRLDILDRLRSDGPLTSAELPDTCEVPWRSSGWTNNQNVVKMLDKLVQYYGRHEPSSPIPILLERAKRLVPMNFFEIMKDLAPEGIAQLTVIRGPDGSEAVDEY